MTVFVTTQRAAEPYGATSPIGRGRSRRRARRSRIDAEVTHPIPPGLGPAIGELEHGLLPVVLEDPGERRHPRVGWRLALVGTDVDLKRGVAALDDFHPITDLVIVGEERNRHGASQDREFVGGPKLYSVSRRHSGIVADHDRVRAITVLGGVIERANGDRTVLEMIFPIAGALTNELRWRGKAFGRLHVERFISVDDGGQAEHKILASGRICLPCNSLNGWEVRVPVCHDSGSSIDSSMPSRSSSSCQPWVIVCHPEPRTLAIVGSPAIVPVSLRARLQRLALGILCNQRP